MIEQEVETEEIEEISIEDDEIIEKRVEIPLIVETLETGEDLEPESKESSDSYGQFSRLLGSHSIAVFVGYMIDRFGLTINDYEIVEIPA